MIYFNVFITAMLVCLVITPVFIKYAKTIKLIDVPDARKVHVNLVPRVGGISMVLGTLFSILIGLEVDQHILAYILGVIVIAVFGIWDDRVQLSYKVKFIGQFLAILIVIIYGDVKVDNLPFIYYGIIPDYISIPFTIFALLGITNAINLSDGLDGLAGGSCLFSLGVIAFLGYMYGDSKFVILCLAVIGAVFGFLRFNTYPAVIFMGDTGSQFLGFSLGVLVIWLCQLVAPVLSPSIAIIILGFPILDTFYVISQRIIEGKSPFKPDNRHIHHRLLASGLNHYEAVCMIYFIQSVLVVFAYIFRFHNDLIILLCFFLASIFMIFLLELLVKKGSVKQHKKRIVFIYKFIQEGAERKQFIRCFPIIGIISLLSYYLLVVSYISVVASDILIIVTIILCQIFFIGIYKRNILNRNLLRLELYFTATLITYLIIQNLSEFTAISSILNSFYILFLFIIVIGFVLPETDKKNVTPLDYIIIFVIILFSLLSEQQFAHIGHFSHDIARLFMFFYLSEFILSGREKDLFFMKLGLIFILIIIMLKGIFI